MNKYLLTLGIFFLTTILHGQEITKEQIVKFKIRSITTLYNWEGRQSTIDYYNELGNLVKTEVEFREEFGIARWLVYDSNNFLQEERGFDMKGEEFIRVQHLYNTKNQLIKTEEFSPEDRSIERAVEYWYDENGRKKKMLIEEKTGKTETTYTYSGDKLVEEVVIDLTTNSEEQITYLYNGKGQLIQKKEQQDQDKNVFVTKYTYNQQGKVIRIENGVTIEYKYNDRGLLEREIGLFKIKYKYTDMGLLESETINGSKKIRYKIGF